MGAIEPAGNLARGKLLRLEDREAKNEEGFLGMPTIVGPVDANQEYALERIIDMVRLCMKAGKMSLHGRTSSGWL